MDPKRRGGRGGGSSLNLRSTAKNLWSAKKEIVIYNLLQSLFLLCIATMTSLQLLPLFFALHKARTRREKLKAVSAIMTFQFNRMEIPVFRRISIHSPADQLLPHLLAFLRESPTGDLDPLRSAINLRILYGSEKRFKKMFRLSRNVFNTVLDVLSPFLNDGMSRNHEQNVLAST